jgi:diguanylate cyclase (GGDEF)-like protein/PAS domain S-box-containing protein
MTLAASLPRTRRYLAEWGFLLAILLIFGGYIAYSRYQEYLQIDFQERERLSSQTAVIEKNLVPQITSVSKALESVREDLPRWQKQKDGLLQTNRRLQVFGATLPGVRTLLVVSADGQIAASNNEKLIGASLAQREWFQVAARNNTPQTLYVIEPIKSLLNTYVIALARSVSGPNGEFTGVIYASLHPDFAGALLDSVRYTSDAKSFLIHGDGKLFMTMPERPDLVAKDLAVPNSLFTRHRDSGRMTSIFAETAYVTNEERMAAFRTVRPADLSMDKSLVVVVSRDLRSIFAPWRQGFAVEGGMFGLLAVIACLSLYFYQRRQRILDLIAVEQGQLLRNSEERLKEAQRISQLGSWTLDLTAGRLIWSDEIFRLFEIDPNQFSANYEAFLNAIHPQDREAVNQAYTSSLESRAPYEITHRLLMSDGRIKWVHERCTSDFDASGKLLRSQGTVQDVTRSKLADDDLRIAAAAFDSQECMMITDANSVILKVNQAFVETTGYTAAEVVGRTPALLQSGRHNADFYRVMWETIKTTGGWQGEVWDRRKNGEEYPKWLTISAVKGDEGVVTHYIGAHFDITDRKIAEDKINELAYFDQLTGLPNRTLLLDRLKQAMTASARNETHGALLFIDLDNFKTLNDTHGHDMGDLLLKQVAQRVLACVREGDTVARMGGDEFVVMLANLSADEEEAAVGIETVAEKILVTLEQSYLLGALAFRCTASMGITLFRGQLNSIDDLMKQADLAMYKAKEAGRNAFRFFDPHMEATVKERVALEEDLRRAIDAKQFMLYYQAQVVGDGRVTGAEVLVRWQHPTRGMVSPAEFIPLAEETGLILPLGNWILETACAQLAVWAAKPAMAHLTLAVNVSARQFYQADFVAQVLTVLKRSGAHPGQLKLELTESLLVENVQDIIEKMHALKTKGVSFSLDDFGTGYSSLSYLKRLPLDQLKIDQSFVRDVLIDPNDAAIAKTVVALAQSLGLGVIAEGVETEAQQHFLADSGCHAYQGYFFSRPLPVEGFEAFTRQKVMKTSSAGSA